MKILLFSMIIAVTVQVALNSSPKPNDRKLLGYDMIGGLLGAGAALMTSNNSNPQDFYY